MHLISVLACGVAGAESGTAEIYVRGTSTRATYYTDYEGQSSVSSGADVSLDSNGGATVYVNQSVDIDVKNSSGSRVRFFTEMVAAPLVEYQGQSFTGTDYTTGASATSKPITLQQILDLWYGSGGATDFKVGYAGSSVTIAQAISSLAGYFYNVKDASYGAVGDGITDDTAAITDALTTAAVTGGVVLFPPGTYRITSAITPENNVSLLGVGPYASIITIDHASNNAITYSNAATDGYQFISELGITASQTNSGKLIQATAAVKLTLRNCHIGGSYSKYSLYISAINDHFINVYDCIFEQGSDMAGSDGFVVVTGASADHTGWFNFNGCLFVSSSSQVTSNSLQVWGKYGSFSGCTFDLSGVTAAATVSAVGTHDIIISSCRFIGSAAATSYATNYVGLAYNIQELGSHHDSNMWGNKQSASGQDAGFACDLTRESKKFTVTSDAAALTIYPERYGVIQLVRTAAADQTLSCGDKTVEGGYFTLFIYNTAGLATGNFTLSATYFRNVGVFSVAAGMVRVLHFISIADTTTQTIKWNLIADSGDMTP